MIDVSPSMADPASSSSSSEAGKATKLAQALAYVELKLAQFVSPIPPSSCPKLKSWLFLQMMRGLKTLEAGVVVFGSSSPAALLYSLQFYSADWNFHTETRNLLSESGREGYEGIRLLVPIMYSLPPSTSR